MSVGELIQEDRPCRNCKYNLKGLRVGDECPECGNPIADKRTSSQTRSYPALPEMELGVLRRYRFSLVGLIASGLAITFPIYAFLFLMAVAVLGIRTPAWVGGVAAFWVATGVSILGSMTWSLCVWLVTVPRPAEGDKGGADEWRMLRTSTRLTQLGMPIAAILGVLAEISVLPTFVQGGFAIGSVISTVIVAAGWVPLAIYLSFVADWGSDQDLGDKLRASSWFMAVGALLVLLSFPVGAVVPILGWFLLIPGGLAAAGGALFGAVQAAHLASEMKWAIINSLTAVAREERRAARQKARDDEAARRFQKGQAQAVREAPSGPGRSPAPVKPPSDADMLDRSPQGPRATKNDAVIGSSGDDGDDDLIPYDLEDDPPRPDPKRRS